MLALGGRKEDEINSTRRVTPRNAGVPPQAKIKESFEFLVRSWSKEDDYLERTSDLSM